MSDPRIIVVGPTGSGKTTLVPKWSKWRRWLRAKKGRRLFILETKPK